jgi:hypothetical protein
MNTTRQFPFVDDATCAKGWNLTGFSGRFEEGLCLTRSGSNLSESKRNDGCLRGNDPSKAIAHDFAGDLSSQLWRRKIAGLYPFAVHEIRGAD